MKIGAHVRGGLGTAIPAALERGAEAVQLFASNPRGWAPPRIGDEQAEGFRLALAASGLGPLFVHAPYLVNIASANPGFLARSVELARRSVTASAELGASGFVVHAGSGGPGATLDALERAAASLRSIVPESECPVLVELTAGTAGSVAATFREAEALFDAVADPRLLLCADTCHLFAAGYALDAEQGVGACFAELRSTGLAGRLALVHANDARFERGSHRDRHANIGEGMIGLDGFAAILRRPELAHVPLVVETPGQPSDQARDVATLRRLAGASAG